MFDWGKPASETRLPQQNVKSPASHAPRLWIDYKILFEISKDLGLANWNVDIVNFNILDWSGLKVSHFRQDFDEYRCATLQCTLCIYISGDNLFKSRCRVITIN